ncbi:MAG: serine/threonine protein kinase, partial [Phycisphaerales bacterium]
SYAHQHGVIHRDLKPGNVLVDSDGEPHVVDFGLAKTARPDFTGDGTPMTVTGEFMGTLAYASPEQAKGDPSKVDVRSDVYSLGVMLYRVLTGVQPYAFSANLGEMVRRITEVEPPRPSTVNRGLGDDIDTVVLKALAKDRERRYQSAGELTQDIERLLAGLPVEAKRDSLGYVLRTRTRRYVFRHLVASIAGAVLMVIVLAEWGVVTPLIGRTPVYRYLSRLVTTYAAPIEPITAFEHVRIIGLTDDTDMEAIAEREGLEGVTERTGRSLRRLHGRLMEKLVGTGIGVLVWDITFRAPPTEFDEDFARGALALRDDGVDVVVAVKKAWWERGPPKISPVIEPVVRTGAVTANFGSSGPWHIWLFVDRPRQESAVSLALQALASYRLPGCDVDIAGHAEGHELTLSYWAPDVAGQTLGPRAHLSDRVVVTEYSRPPKDASDIGMRRGDKVAYSLLHMPRNAVLQASTIDYTRVFSAGPEELRQLLADKIVIVGDVRKDTDLHGHPDGRFLRGCHGHAACI